MSNDFVPMDGEEQDLLESIGKDEWKSSDKLEELKAQAKQYAASTLKKDKRMNIRIAERDLINLKVKALEEGLPYQTLVSMVLHKYVTGQLVEKSVS
ncbi:MAG: antitoxin [Spirochaetales bacterium]|nr:antitoxin [Spirochaetales bacterium]